METEIFLQEILIRPCAFSKSLGDKTSSENWRTLPDSERFKEDCWNGLLDQLLAGIISDFAVGIRPAMWEIRQGNAVLGLELCNREAPIEKHSSIYPYFLMQDMQYN